MEDDNDEIFSCAFNYEGNTIITGRLGFCVCVWGGVGGTINGWWKITLMSSSAVL